MLGRLSLTPILGLQNSSRSRKEAGLADPQKQRCHYNGNLAAFQNCVCDENIETGSLVALVPGKYPSKGK